jgi:hypothetical protein
MVKSVSRVEEYLIARHGGKINTIRWTATDAKPIVCGLMFAHGYTNYVGTLYVFAKLGCYKCVIGLSDTLMQLRLVGSAFCRAWHCVLCA